MECSNCSNYSQEARWFTWKYRGTKTLGYGRDPSTGFIKTETYTHAEGDIAIGLCDECVDNIKDRIIQNTKRIITKYKWYHTTGTKIINIFILLLFASILVTSVVFTSSFEDAAIAFFFASFIVAILCIPLFVLSNRMDKKAVIYLTFNSSDFKKKLISIQFCPTTDFFKVLMREGTGWKKEAEVIGGGYKLYRERGEFLDSSPSNIITRETNLTESKISRAILSYGGYPYNNYILPLISPKAIGGSDEKFLIEKEYRDFLLKVANIIHKKASKKSVDINLGSSTINDENQSS